jgi:hypothetical protein
MRAYPQTLRALALGGLGLSLAASACASPSWGYPEVSGRMVAVSVEVEGTRSALFPDPGGSGRYYLEARAGSRYVLLLQNRTRERLGVVVSVDGLNVISGERAGGGERMYVLDPWGTTTIQGWRTSLADVRRFTFVDERISYAARSGKANGRMGWIEVKTYRERGHAYSYSPMPTPEPWYGRDSRPAEDKAAPSTTLPPRATPPPTEPYAEGDEALAEKRADRMQDGGAALERSGPPAAAAAPERSRSFPGTGWGARTEDPVTVVSFEPEATAAECVTLRYEYAGALRALGIPVWPEPNRDRLSERERGEWGFAKPPTR